MDWGCGWQCGKGRDVGLNQIAAFEGKVASGNGEQSLSRDIYRLGQLFDFFRMCSFFFTSVGYYFTTMVGDLCPEFLQRFIYLVESLAFCKHVIVSKLFKLIMLVIACSAPYACISCLAAHCLDCLRVPVRQSISGM